MTKEKYVRDTLRRESEMGWLPSLPDVRDKSVANIIGDSKLSDGTTIVPTWEISRTLFSPVEDQKSIGSCTANAAVGIMEYYQRAMSNKHVNLSRLFLYKTTRNLMGVTGDTGAYLRDTMKAMRLFGVLPEEDYQYRTNDFDKEPEAKHYAMASNYKTSAYFRVDLPGMSPQDILLAIKVRLLRGCPLMFGFSCYESINQNADPDIKIPEHGERQVGGHAMVITGYDDTKKRFSVRNSWGLYWGSYGYGTLPYWYLEMNQMSDIWGILKQEWVDTGKFR